MPTEARSRASTIAFERTCLHTFQANSISPHSASDGLRSLTTSISERSSRSMSRSWTRSPPITRLTSHSVMFMRRRSLSSRMRRFGLVASASTASSVKRGASTTSTNCSRSAAASSRSTGRLKQMTPPNADRSEEHTSELQSRQYLVCRLLLEKKKKIKHNKNHKQKNKKQHNNTKEKKT